jgi:hypothetical protein
MRIPWQTVPLEKSTLATALHVGACCILFAGAALGGPCTAQIDQLESQIRQAASEPVAGPTASQTVDAQLHHQPTPGAVQHGKAEANADGGAALERARKADTQGDANACNEAMREARELYGLDAK